MAAIVITIFKQQALTSSFVAGEPFLLQANKLVLDFTVIVTTLATVEWYPEYSTDPFADTPVWFRETTEETIGSGVVNNVKSVHKLLENGGAGLAAGTHTMDAQMTRTQQFVRLQARVSAGAAELLVETPFGQLVRAAS